MSSVASVVARRGRTASALKSVTTEQDECGLTLKQAAARLNCSADHLSNLAALGLLPVVRVPGIGRRAARIIVMPADLERCIEQWKAQPVNAGSDSYRRR